MEKLKKKKLPTKLKKKDFPKKKHNWKKDKDGSISYIDFGGYHAGPECADCDFGGCQHCDEDIFEDTSCAFEQAENEYYAKLAEVNTYNSHVDFYNEQVREDI